VRQNLRDELFESGAKAKVKVFVGLELITDRGQYLCFFPKPETAPEPVQLWGSNREKPWSAAECLPKVRSLGGLVCAVEGYNARVKQMANDLAVQAAEMLKVPCTGDSDARATVDEVGYGATFFKNPIQTQAQLVAALLAGDFYPVMAGELPRLTRPGEAQAAHASGKQQRRGGGGGGGRRRR
jgi:PHP domain-containing protein